MPIPKLPETLEGAQAEGSILGTFRRDFREGGTDFAVTRHEVSAPLDFNPAGPYAGFSDQGTGLSYLLYEVYEIVPAGGTVKPTDEIIPIGGILFQMNEIDRIATVAYSGLRESYRSLGIGRAMYQMAINDLIENRYEVTSDISLSDSARGVWESIRRKNRGRVTKETDDEGETAIFTATRFVKRHSDVRVHKHRRRQ